MRKYIFCLTVFIFVWVQSFGQSGHINVFPNLKGEELLSALVAEYKTTIVLDYSIARDTLFSKIDGVQDSLECIYTGMKLYMPPSQDPTEAVYLNGLPNGINNEHTWPQGLGAIGLAQSDMHHLYPTRTKANSDRGNFPFGEIPDSQTQTWYYKTSETNSPPSVNRDLYSEGIRGNNGKFEPRESVKGNIARSIFYFYTMYKSQADAQGPAFFQSMKNDLCNWHYADPVDQKEWDRNQKIAKYQGDKLNPYVLDCSLVSRAYCNNIDQACKALLSNVVDDQLPGKIQIFPNPSQGTFFIKINTSNQNIFIVDIKNIFGQTIFLSNYNVENGQNKLDIDISDQLAGFYMVHLKSINGSFELNIPYIIVW